MKHNVMKALILEDDTLLADLLETVVGGLYPGIDIFRNGVGQGGSVTLVSTRF